MKPTYQDIKAAAQYRWQEIHAAIGIDPRYLKTNTSHAPPVVVKTVSGTTTRTVTAHSFAAITTMARATVSAW